MKGSNEQTYNRVPQLGSAQTCPSTNEQPDSESPFSLTESCHDENGPDGSLPDDDELTPHPTAGENSWSIIKRILTTNLVDDKRLLYLYRRLCRAGNDPGIDDGGLTTIKLVKLWILSFIGLMFVHRLARSMGWEIDKNYTLQDFVKYDFSAVLLDLSFFFVIGRLYKTSCRGIDRLFPWGFFVALGFIYPSIANDFAFLRHSISMYDIVCSWPVLLYIYALVLVVFAIVFSVALVRSHHRRNVLPSRIFEAITLLCLFILPYARSGDSFHLHHWFGMWWLGMQSNAPEWWAQSFQAFALGSYINGIAVYGRDPILGCGLAFYRSTNMECKYMQCYKEAATDTGNAGNTGNETEYKDFVTPDWRICNAAALRNP